MEQYKNIIMGSYGDTKTFGYEVWTLADNGNGFNITKRLVASDNRDLKLGQEVNLQRTLTANGTPGKIIISSHDNSHISGMAGQLKRLQNIKPFAIEYLKSQRNKKAFLNFYSNEFLKTEDYDFTQDEEENLISAFKAFNYDKISTIEEVVTSIVTEKQDMPQKLYEKNIKLYSEMENDANNFEYNGFDPTIKMSKSIDAVASYINQAIDCVKNPTKKQDRTFE